MAVREGVPIERLCSLAELVRPDASMREKHYNRASSLSATQSFGALVRALRNGSANQGRAEPPVGT
jgi:hypothetical protein